MSSNLLYHHSFSIMELCFPHRCVGLVPINVRIINMVYSGARKFELYLCPFSSEINYCVVLCDVLSPR